MTPERAYAYRRVLHTLNELGPTKLLGPEQERIRAAADSLLFTHDRLEVQIGPWGVCGLFGGEADTMFAASNPGTAQVLADGRSVPAACPNRPQTRAFLESWIDAALHTGADRIFCDEPHWIHPEEFGF